MPIAILVTQDLKFTVHYLSIYLSNYRMSFVWTIGIQVVICVFAIVWMPEVTSKVEICPTWFVFNSSSRMCTCQNLKEWVVCDQLTGVVKLAKGICMTYDNKTRTTDVGKCPYTLLDTSHVERTESGYTELPNDTVELNEFLCDFWNREGYLCSRCKNGCGLTIANIFQKCSECKYPKALGWLLYFILQLIPLTVFFFIVSFFRISLAKPPMNAFVVFCQLCTCVFFVYAYKFYPPYISDGATLQKVQYFVFLCLGIWSMTLTRYLNFGITSFCVDPSINTQQAFLLTQIQSLFPLFLVFITHASIILHTRNCRLIVWLWRPFHRCYIRFSHMWNSKLSLVDAFSTFLLLSYSRFIVQSYYMFSFQFTYTLNRGWNSRASLLYNPGISYFHPSYHLPYVLLLLFIFLLVAIPPIVLLALYQIKAFQKFLACIHLHNIPSIHIFVDVFHGCFKDGTNGTFDLRFASSFYLIFRIVLLLSFLGCNSAPFENCSLVFTFIFIFTLLLFFALVRPYKEVCWNVSDSLLLAGVALICFLLNIITKTSTFNRVILVTILIIIVIPQAILYSYVFYRMIRLLFNISYFSRFFMQVRNKLKCSMFEAGNDENVEFELTESFLNRTGSFGSSDF